PPTSRASARLSRREVLRLVTAAVLACLLPTFRHAPIQAHPQPGPADAQARSRIYVSGVFRYKPEGSDEETRQNLIIAIDPDTGKWQTITDQGHAGRVSPDRRLVVL